MRKALRVGVVGIGTMGRNHARIYSELADVELAGVADIDEKLAISVAQSHKCKAYTNYKELLNERLDVVSIVVPTILHKEVAHDAIAMGMNVLVEKPIADTVENADEIIKAAQRQGIKLMVGHVERFNPAITKLRELICSGQLGHIISISAKRVGPHNPRIRDVGIILDLGTHDIDVMSYLIGQKVKEVYASAGRATHSREDYAIIMLNFDNGVSGVIETNWLTPHKVRNLTVVGSEGIAEVNYIEVTLRIYDKEWTKDAKVEKVEPLKLELEHFVDCVQHDKEPSVLGQDGKHALEVAVLAEESSRTGKVYQIS